MKMTWFVICGTTAAVLALMGSPALGQGIVQSITIVNSGSSQHSQISTSSSSSSTVQTSSQQQGSRLTIPVSQLNRSYQLNVVAPSMQLEGEIKLNGRTIHRLQGGTNSIDLSPHLTVGNHVLTISGSFTPAQGTIQISLVGSGTALSQQVSGSGRLASQIYLAVQ